MVVLDPTLFVKEIEAYVYRTVDCMNGLSYRGQGRGQWWWKYFFMTFRNNESACSMQRELKSPKVVNSAHKLYSYSKFVANHAFIKLFEF